MHTVTHILSVLTIIVLSWMLLSVKSDLQVSKQECNKAQASYAEAASTNAVIMKEMQKYITFKDQVFAVFCKHRVGDVVETERGVGTIKARMVQPVMVMYDVQYINGDMQRIYDTNITGRVSE